MADFNQAYLITMQNEGGYANDPQDRGGETWKGIARNFWPQWKGWVIVDTIKATNPPVLNKALAAQTDLNNMVLQFYKSNYWDINKLDQINSQQVANQLFDIAVNMGVGRASKFLQQAISPQITVDGVIGPKTVAGANAMEPKQLYDAINVLRTEKYNQIIAANPSQAKFKNSWFSRIKPYDSSLPS
ncbi:MAG: hypothetical protein H7Y13_13525 [Sphingobacteriaceae bacterium]|nr:hypothetical protein [Sphingobacteriaceae bacterium]